MHVMGSTLGNWQFALMTAINLWLEWSIMPGTIETRLVTWHDSPQPQNGREWRLNVGRMLRYTPACVCDGGWAIQTHLKGWMACYWCAVSLRAIHTISWRCHIPSGATSTSTWKIRWDQTFSSKGLRRVDCFKLAQTLSHPT